MTDSWIKHRVLIVGLFIVLASPSWAGFDEGMAAYRNGNYTEALREWEEAAKQGDSESQNALGYLYQAGHGVERDIGKAVVWYMRSAESGYPSALLNLGILYELGEGVPQDHFKAAEFYRQAADQGIATAQFRLAQLMRRSDQIYRDEKAIEQLYRNAAEQGFPPAQCTLGKLYEFGRIVDKNKEQARAWYKKAADQYMRDARATIQELYAEDTSGVKGDTEICQLFEIAAKQNDKDGALGLAACYSSGVGKKQDLAQAFFWYSVWAAMVEREAVACIRDVLFRPLVERMSAAESKRSEQMLIDWRAEQYESRTASLDEVQMKQLRNEARQYMTKVGPKQKHEFEDHKACLKQLRASMVWLADMGFALATIEQGRDYFLAVVIANLPSLTSESIHECKGPIYGIWG